MTLPLLRYKLTSITKEMIAIDEIPSQVSNISVFALIRLCNWLIRFHFHRHDRHQNLFWTPNIRKFWKTFRFLAPLSLDVNNVCFIKQSKESKEIRALWHPRGN